MHADIAAHAKQPLSHLSGGCQPQPVADFQSLYGMTLLTNTQVQSRNQAQRLKMPEGCQGMVDARPPRTSLRRWTGSEKLAPADGTVSSL
jgi:hypothetical protein